METKTIVQELNRSSDAIPEAELDALIEKVKSHKRVFVYGTGRSGLMLKAFAMRLMQLGLTAYVVGETTTPSIEAGDLLALASASGETGSVCMTAQSALKQGAELAVITSAPQSTLGKIQTPDVVIESATKFSASDVSVQPLGSLFERTLLILFDAAAMNMNRILSWIGASAETWELTKA